MLHQSIFKDLNINLKAMSIDEIKRRLEPIFKGMVVESPILDSGVFLYRARKIDSTFNKTIGIRYVDLIYPPSDKSKLGRVNRDNESVFYCSLGKEPLFFELPNLQAGSEIIVTFWRAMEKMYVNNVGYTQSVFDQFGATRPFPQWSQSRGSNKANISLPDITEKQLKAVMAEDENREVRRAISEQFMSMVNKSETEKYKLTAAIGELHLGSLNDAQQFAGILYPSVRMMANGDNLALRPWFVDQHLSFRKATHIRIDKRKGTKLSVSHLDHAKEFDAYGQLYWLT